MRSDYTYNPFLLKNEYNKFIYRTSFKDTLNKLINEIKSTQKTLDNERCNAINDIDLTKQKIQETQGQKNRLKEEILSNSLPFKDACELLDKYDQSKTDEFSIS